MRQTALALCVVVVAACAPAFGQAVPSSAVSAATGTVAAPPAAAVTAAEQEAFLRSASIAKVKGVKIGTTGTQRATLSKGSISHDASIQNIDQTMARFEGAKGVEFNFRDYWGYNVAAYRLGRMLEIDSIPPSVARTYRYGGSAFTWWIDDVILDEKARLAKKLTAPDPTYWSAQIYVMRVFDELISNMDRNQGNMLIDKDWKLWLIDHSRAFRLNETLRNVKGIIRCERRLFERLKALDARTMKAELDDYLTEYEQAAVLKRRNLIVARIDALGPSALYDMPRR